jgi:hypothetical protein
LGASSAGLLRQTIAESLTLSLSGSILGIGVADGYLSKPIDLAPLEKELARLLAWMNGCRVGISLFTSLEELDFNSRISAWQ